MSGSRLNAPRRRLGGALVTALALATMTGGCDRRSPAAGRLPPAEVQADSTGHYCGMLLVDHDGPKGQIHLASRARPVWFSSVRDTIAFTRLPEEPRDVTAIYVSDMARATQWQQPEPGAWVDARQAWFVIESDMRGGMGAVEAVPFSAAPAAEAFRARHGGRVVRLADIPDDYVLGATTARDAAPRPDAPARGASR